MSSLCEELLRVQKMYLAAKIDYLNKGKADTEAKLL
jgi:hypothetical protein